MAKKDTKNSFKDQVIAATLALAAEQPWTEVSCEQIIALAQVDVDEFYEYFDDKTDILCAYGRQVDRRVLESVAEDVSGLTEREVLFDLLMERFDIINENRDAIISILGSCKRDPKQAVVGFPHLAHSMSRMLEAAGISTEGLRGAANVTGLVGVYIYVLRTWQNDEAPDMAQTMAALDKTLGFAEQAANSFAGGSLGGLCAGLPDLCRGFADKYRKSFSDDIS